MDERKYNTLMDVFRGILDPRKARGQCYGWLSLLILIAGAMVSGVASYFRRQESGQAHPTIGSVPGHSA